MPPKNVPLIDEHPLIVLPTLAVAIGLEKSIVVQQIHYWLENKRRSNDTQSFKGGRYWVYNTVAEWHEQFPFMSERTILRLFAELREKKILLVEQFGKNGWDHTNWYSLDYDKLAELIETTDDDKLSSSLPPTCHDLNKNTDTTTDTTSRTKNVRKSNPKEQPRPKRSDVQELVAYFENTVIPAPLYAKQPELQKLWRNPLAEILQLAAGNTVLAQTVIETTVREMRRDNLTISSPNSILNNARSNFGKVQANSTIMDSVPYWGA